jgi:hypothetical protein
VGKKRKGERKKERKKEEKEKTARSLKIKRLARAKLVTQETKFIV